MAGLFVKKRSRTSFPPFTLDLASADGLCDQVTAGLRESIRTGFYKSGDVLPSMARMAKALGVSEIVLRGACRRLQAEGLLMARPRVGNVVLPPRTPVWRGQVLCVLTDHDLNPQICVVVEKLRERLTRNGFMFSQVTVIVDTDEKLDFSGLDFALKRPLDFVVTIFRHPEIERRISASGIPFAVVGGKGDVQPGCVGSVVYSGSHARTALVRQCRRQGIGSVKIVASCKRGGMQECLLEDLRTAGISASIVLVDVVPDENRRFEAVVSAGYAFVVGNLRRKGFRFPDLYIVCDDFLATGMLQAFLEAGKPIPETVRLVSYSNGGFGPYFPKSVACLEADAAANGNEVADRIGGWLLRRRPFPSSYLQHVFRPGETFPA